MACVITFYVPDSFRPKVKRIPPTEKSDRVSPRAIAKDRLSRRLNNGKYHAIIQEPS